VVLIFKKSNKNKEDNYLPISLLPVLSRILEKLVKVRLVCFLEKLFFFSKKQFGFRAGFSTEDALQQLFTNIYSSFNKTDCCKSAGLFLGVSKAFDTIDHELLLEKLELAGIRGVPLSWFRSYLLGRRQAVRVKSKKSNLLNIQYGVPQGSVLGPILFLIFVNDFCDGSFNGHLTAFADDTALSYSAETFDELHYKMQSDLNRISLWFSCNKLSLNVSKTVYIIFSLSLSSRFDLPLKYHKIGCNHYFCNCEIIKQCEYTKYLGLQLDENLSWKKHINNLKYSLRSLLRIFFNLKYICPTSTLKQVYYSLVNSRLEYGISVYGSTYKSHLNSLLILQKKFIRLISHSGYMEHSLPLFINLSILPLRYLYIFKVLATFYKLSGNNGPTVDIIHGYNTRQISNNILRPPKPRCSLFRKSFVYLAYKFFNILPNPIKNSSSLVTFKKKLKKWLLTNNFEQIELLY